MTNWEEASNEEIMDDVTEEANKHTGISSGPPETTISTPSTLFKFLMEEGYIVSTDEKYCDELTTEDFKSIYPSVHEGTRVIKSQYSLDDNKETNNQ